MKFLCLISAEKCIDQLSEADAATHFEEYRVLIERLRQSGNYVDGRRLLPPENAVTLRVRNGKVAVTDGPFAETKEQLGGLFVLEAKDMKEAIQLASQIPGAKIGCVEIRPIAEDPQTLQALR